VPSVSSFLPWRGHCSDHWSRPKSSLVLAPTTASPTHPRPQPAAWHPPATRWQQLIPREPAGRRHFDSPLFSSHRWLRHRASPSFLLHWCRLLKPKTPRSSLCCVPRHRPPGSPRTATTPEIKAATASPHDSPSPHRSAMPRFCRAKKWDRAKILKLWEHPALLLAPWLTGRRRQHAPPPEPLRLLR
jgi:hypothetical protein